MRMAKMLCWYSTHLMALACFAQTPEPGHGNVELFAVGSRGEALRGCAVRMFQNTETHDNVAPRFRELVGKNIAFGSYLVSVRCVDHGASSVVTVSRREQFLIISSAQSSAIHYPPGVGPSFLVRVTGLTRPAGGRQWVQVIGLYRDERAAEPLDEGSATLSVTEGLYQLVIFEENEVICSGAISIDGPRAGIEVAVGKTCAVSATKSVTLQQNSNIILAR